MTKKKTKNISRTFILTHNIMERAAAIIRETSNFLVGFKCCNKLDNIVKAHKVVTEIISNINVIQNSL